jgi:hypothetical protein
VDVILEMLANVNLAHDTQILANNGRVIVIGSRGEVTMNPRELMTRRASIRALALWALRRTKRRTSTLGSLQASKTALCAPSLARNCRSPRRRARTRRSLNPGLPARLCSSADRQSQDSDDELAKAVTREFRGSYECMPWMWCASEAEF